MNIITDKDQVFYFCKKEYNEKEKDNVPEDDIAYYGWSNNMNLDFGSYIRGYKYAAEATYNEVKNCNGRIYIQDTICYPLVFLYRHIVELYLKYAYIEIQRRSEQEIKQLLKIGHDLEKLWSFLKPDIVILSQRINLCVDIKAIEHYITSISKEDKMSIDYRYPITKSSQVIHNKSSYLNVKNLHDKMNAFYKYFDNTISCLKNQLFYLKYNEDFNRCFLKEIESSLDIIQSYIELRIKLDAEEKNRDKHVTNAWLSLGEIPNERKKEKDTVYEYVNKLTENQKSLLIILYLTGRDINSYKEKLAYEKEEHLKDIFRLIYSNCNCEVNFNNEKNLMKENLLHKYMFGSIYSVDYVKKYFTRIRNKIIIASGKRIPEITSTQSSCSASALWLFQNACRTVSSNVWKPR